MKTLLILLIPFFSVTARTQTMRQVLPTVPDSICRLLTHNNILDFPDYLDTQMKAEVHNRLNGNSEMQTLTDDYTLIRVSESSTLQLKLLPSSKSQIILAAYTYYLNDSTADSQLRFYDLKWQPLPAEKYIKMERKPNTLVEAKLTPSDSGITLKMVNPFRITPINDNSTTIPTQEVHHLVWNGKKFK